MYYKEIYDGEEKEDQIETDDAGEAEEMRRLLEAKLLLGMPTEDKTELTWREFRALYSEIELMSLRDSTAVHSESRLDIGERILKPQNLSDMATAKSLTKLQAELLRGAESRFNKKRVPAWSRNARAVSISAWTLSALRRSRASFSPTAAATKRLSRSATSAPAAGRLRLLRLSPV